MSRSGARRRGQAEAERGNGGRRVGMPARLAAAFGLAITVLAATASPAAATTPFDECVARRTKDGMTRVEAVAECMREVGPTATTVTDRPRDDESDASDDRRNVAADDGGGTSWGLVVGAAVLGLAAGAALAWTLLRRGRGSAAPAVATGMPGGFAAAPVLAPPAAAPTYAPAAPLDRGPDRAPGLVGALIDLGDRVPSQALRAEILAALGRAGVQVIDIAPGEPFDATRMRGVGGAPTADPALVGRVAATDRPGFRDGAQLVRLPDVIVHTAG